MIADIAAGHISIKYGFRGPNYATVSACASSTHAMIDAFNYINGERQTYLLQADPKHQLMLLVLVDSTQCMLFLLEMTTLKTASRPFDKDREGFVLGEGGEP